MAMKKSSFNMIPDDISGTVQKDMTAPVSQPEIISDSYIKPVQEHLAQPPTPVIPIVSASPVQQVQAGPAPRKRIYVYITEEHYKHVKRECGATDTTIQDYFDNLIEKEMTENEHHYR